METRKKAFTLAEVMVCMTIIGIIMALSAHAIKITKESYISLTYFANKNMEASVGALYANSDNDEALLQGNGTKLPKMVTKCKSSSGFVNVLKNDDEYEVTTIPKCNERAFSGNNNIFCKGLAAISNTSGKVNCNNLYNTTLVSNKYGNMEPRFSGLTPDNPNFVTTNGQRFYISKWKFDPTNVSDTYGYRLVGIDLNGKARPNTDNIDSKTPPDIVTFLVLDNGELYPLGVAADNKISGDNKMLLYFNSQIKGYYYTPSSGVPETLAPECKAKDKNGVVHKVCDIRIIYLKDSQSDIDDTNACNPALYDGKNFFTYRESFCRSGVRGKYIKYCDDDKLKKHAFCPPSNCSQVFDTCLQYNVRPAFRYNL